MRCAVKPDPRSVRAVLGLLDAQMAPEHERSPEGARACTAHERHSFSEARQHLISPAAPVNTTEAGVEMKLTQYLIIKLSFPFLKASSVHII